MRKDSLLFGAIHHPACRKSSSRSCLWNWHISRRLGDRMVGTVFPFPCFPRWVTSFCLPCPWGVITTRQWSGQAGSYSGRPDGGILRLHSAQGQITAFPFASPRHPGYDRGMDWIDLICWGVPIVYCGYRFIAFVRDLERRDKLSRRPPDAL